MSSDSESTRYTLYKEGTTRLVRWLVRTVSSCSIAFVNAPVKDTHSTADLTRYASAILAAIPPADIPSSILELVNDVIVGRSVCADWYSSRAARSSTDQSELRAGNRSHRHFIQVLQEVRDTLREARLRRSRDGPSRPASDETTSQDESAAKESLSNMFERLDFEDTPDEPFSDAESPTPKPRTGDSTRQHGLLELDDKAEKEFALWCFLEDLYEAKLFVKQTWNEYLVGQLSYLAASAITEAAFGVMRRADLVFSTTNPELSDSVAIYRRLGIRVGKMSPRDATVIPQAEASEGDIAPKADYLCLTGHVTLIDYFNIWGELQHDIGTLQDTREAALPSYVAYSFERKVDAFNRRKLELIEKHCTAYNHHPFMPILMETVFDVGALSRYKGAIPCNHLDEFLRGLLNLLTTASVPVWMCVACDCYMSICDALLGKLDIGTRVLHDTVAHSKATVTDYVTFVKNYRANYPTDSLAWLESRINEEMTNLRIMETSGSADDRLRTVQMSLKAHLRKKFNHLMHKAVRKQESDAMIVGDLLFEAGRCTQASRKLEGTHIAKAAVILEEFLAREGSDKFIKPALEMSSGHIPERNWPDARTQERRKVESREMTENGGESEAIQEYSEQQEPAATKPEQQVSDDGLQPDIRKIYDARKKPRGRRLLRTRK